MASTKNAGKTNRNSTNTDPRSRLRLGKTGDNLCIDVRLASMDRVNGCLKFTAETARSGHGFQKLAQLALCTFRIKSRLQLIALHLLPYRFLFLQGGLRLCRSYFFLLDF